MIFALCIIKKLSFVFRPTLYLEIQIEKLVLKMFLASHRKKVMFYFLKYSFIAYAHTSQIDPLYQSVTKDMIIFDITLRFLKGWLEV